MCQPGRAVRCVAVLVLLLLPCAIWAGRVVSVTLCKGVIKPDMVPVDIQEHFAPDVAVIHALIAVEDLAAGAKLKGEWVSVDAISTPNYIIDTAELVAKEASTTAHFTISRPNKGWPPGNYRLNFYIDGKLAAVKRFKIAAEPVARTPAPAPEFAPAPALPQRPVETAPPISQREEPAIGFTGTYTLQAERATITLVMKQSADGSITGTLSSTTGMQFQLQGKVEEGEALGICSSNEGKVFFEAHLEGNQLQLALIEPDANNMPNYQRARQIVLTRTGGGARPAAPAAQPEAVPHPAAPSGAFGSRPAQGGLGRKPSGEEVSDPGWGFRFYLPAGWKVKKEPSGALLGHDTIAGAILVFPHMAGSFQEVQQQMQVGISEEQSQLTLIGRTERLSENAVAGIYQGMYQGQQVKARGIGTFSPSGGGAYILAITLPDKFTSELAQAADAVARSLEPARVEVSDVMQHFVGTWFSYTKNTSNEVTLYPDGTFSMNYEASYSGNPTAGGATDWGLARQDRNKGRWTVRGTRSSGVIILKYPNGNTEEVQYRVHEEGGQVYWSEYYFDGNLYGKKRQ